MTTTQLEFEAAAGGTTQNAQLMRIFVANPNEWLSMTFLVQSIHAYAVHSRVADLRKLGMNIENESKTVKGSRKRCSLYRYVPQP
jgi:hypothetical protein